MSVENMGNGYVKVGVKQEDLEASIAGLRQLKPILQAQVTRGNGNNTRQAAIDRAEIGKHSKIQRAADVKTCCIGAKYEK